jgi:hypothetical protein
MRDEYQVCRMSGADHIRDIPLSQTFVGLSINTSLLTVGGP